MTNRNIIRAWKDEQYRLSLSEAERALVPGHPAGAMELSDAALDGAAGGLFYPPTYLCPPPWHTYGYACSHVTIGCTK